MISLEAIEQIDLSAVRQVLLGEGLDALVILQMEQEYIQFLLGDDEVPNEYADAFWHAHLQLAQYRTDCLALFGQYLQHIPEGRGRCRKSFCQ